jgi:hypothetical protein
MGESEAQVKPGDTVRLECPQGYFDAEWTLGFVWCATRFPNGAEGDVASVQGQNVWVRVGPALQVCTRRDWWKAVEP